ncbi:MAG: GntR family transcriptional regulator [Phyllobacteriaceae bacterium]|nr:GntR family transcriptional regulator [Phyllobacteriaceae bacterium]
MTESGGGTRAEKIHRDIVRAILEQRLGPGTKLGEDEVGAIYGVSRTIVRAALQSLAHEGIGVIEKNRGAFVAHPSVKEAAEVFQARRLIEPAITELAARACDAAGAALLRAHLARERQAESEGDDRAAIRLSGEFHVVLARIAGHKIYENFLRELVARSSLIILLYRRSRAQCCKIDHHGALVEAIAEGRGAEAAAQMVSHLDEIERDLELVDTAIPVRPLSELLGG